MFEEDAKEYGKRISKGLTVEKGSSTEIALKSGILGFEQGAEFGYNKANEWHFVKDGDYPKEKGNYLVAWKRTHHVEEFGKWGFDVDLFNADEGYFEGVGDYVIAWKEIVLPKEDE